MTKRIIPITDYITAKEAADLLSKNLGRPIASDYIRKLKNVRQHKINASTKLYHREDLAAITIRRRTTAYATSSDL